MLIRITHVGRHIRRYYGVTELGLAVVRAEANRLAGLVYAAQAKDLVGEEA